MRPKKCLVSGCRNKTKNRYCFKHWKEIALKFVQEYEYIEQAFMDGLVQREFKTYKNNSAGSDNTPSDNTITIPNFYPTNLRKYKRNKTGSCSYLATYCAVDIKTEYPNFYYTRIRCSNNLWSTHYVFAISHYEIVPDTDTKRYHDFSGYEIIVDPSHKKVYTVSEFKKEHVIQRYYGENHRLKSGSTLELDEGTCVPLYESKDGEIILLSNIKGELKFRKHVPNNDSALEIDLKNHPPKEQFLDLHKNLIHKLCTYECKLAKLQKKGRVCSLSLNYFNYFN
jgi:hypothetical protein